MRPIKLTLSQQAGRNRLRHIVNLLFRYAVIDQILHILRHRDLPVRVLGLAAVRIHHHMLIANLTDRLQIVRKIALVFATAHILSEAALQNHIVILHQTLLLFHRHTYDPPFRMCNHDVLNA